MVCVCGAGEGVLSLNDSKQKGWLDLLVWQQQGGWLGRGWGKLEQCDNSCHLFSIYFMPDTVHTISF